MPARSIRFPRSLPIGLVLATALGLSACSTIDELKDLEMARGEGRYVPVELVGTLAMGVMRAGDYGAYSSVVHQSYSVGDPITSDGCIDVRLIDGIGNDGEGKVFYDFQPCPNQTGWVQVTQRVLPEGLGDEARDELPEDDWVDSDGDGLPDSLPPGSDDVDWDGLSEDAINDLLGGSADAEVVFNQYREGLLSMNGSLSMSGGVDLETGESGGLLEADLRVEAWHYAGDIQASGDWSYEPETQSRSFSFIGDFVSATGLPWTVLASNVEITPECVDATGGEITAMFENGQGAVTVTARFDSICDGCANILIDGESQGRTCLPDAINPGAGG
ncbi:MAG: hypothetical protein VX498_06715 [Myxococcota bacterium]|nr:hypothetical protein [Myxococcota bacterium]